VLDWEMATLGDPLMDLGTTLAYWAEPGDPDALKMFGVTHLPGNLDRRGVVERYAEKTGRDVSGIAFHHACGLFKVGVIAQQIYARYRAGKTQDPRFAGLIHVVRAAGRMAADVAGR
jgi:aminoglycoside phosphotransferase (APT) family kinase protein